MGHPSPLVLWFGESAQMCPTEHFQFLFIAVPLDKVLGSQPSASLDNFGSVVAKSLKPTNTFLPAQYGQPDFIFVLWATVASQTCSREHLHESFLDELAVTLDGSHPFASEASEGSLLSKSLKPLSTVLPQQIGQFDLFIALCEIDASQT